MQQQLVGYVLGALDDSERQQLEEQIKGDPTLQDELGLIRQAIEPLAWDSQPHAAPAGLAERTCKFVDSQCRSDTPSSHAPSMASDDAVLETAAPSKVHRWSLVDLAVAGGIVVAASLLLFPLISHSQFQARVAQCQSNLTELGRAFQAYGSNHEGRIPEIPRDGKLAIAGVYAPRLLEAGLVSDSKAFVCAGSELACRTEQPEIPAFGRLVELEQSGSSKLDELLSEVGGSYAYNLGYVENDHYHTVSLNDNGNANKILLADVPSNSCGYTQSSNHGGHGQNALFADGHVSYLPNCCNPGSCDEDIYHNDVGEIAAGKRPLDTVLGESAVRP